MYAKGLKYYLTVIVLTIAFFRSEAQLFHPRFVFGPSIGIMNYLGDLDDDFTLKFTKPAFAVCARYQYKPNWSVRGFSSYGFIGARDYVSNNKARNYRDLNFRSRISEVNVQLVFDFFGNSRKFKYRPYYTPYLFAGVGIFNFNPEAKLTGSGSLDGWYELQPLGTEGQNIPGSPRKPYLLTQPSFPLGGGLRFKSGDHVDIEIETGWRKTFTDYIDDVSTVYYNENLISQYAPGGLDQVAMLLSDRANGGVYGTGNQDGDMRGDVTDQDWYIFTGIIFTIHLDFVRCPIAQ